MDNTIDDIQNKKMGFNFINDYIVLYYNNRDEANCNLDTIYRIITNIISYNDLTF